MRFVLVLIIAHHAHAGKLIDFCARLLISDDPYQFNSAPTSWLGRQIEALEIKRRWGRLNDRDASLLAIMRNEIRNREFLESF